MDVRRFLRRFAAVAPPGPAGRAGVPVDRRAAIERELAPVFASLAGAQAAAEDLRATARAGAERLLADSARQAGEELAAARVRAAALRQLAFEERMAAGRAERAALLAGARDEADRIRRQSGDLAPGLAERAIEHLLDAFAAR